MGAGLCDGEGERAYTGYAPHIIRNVSGNVFSLRRFGMFFCRNVRRHVFAETSFAETSGIPLIKQMLGFLDLPSMLEPRGLYRTDGKRPDDVTMIPWEMGKQLVWYVTVVDALAPCRMNRVGGSGSKERDRKSELVFSSTCQIFEWVRNNSDRNFNNVVRYVHITLVP